MLLAPDLIDLLTELQSSGAEYLVVGGWAIGVHAEPRYTKDLDLLIGPSPSNLARVVDALERYGAPAALVDQVRTMTADEFVFFGVPPARVDLLRSIPGVEFDEAWKRRKEVRWSDVDVHVIGFDDLCAAKRAAGRRRDVDDLKLLEKFRVT
jgi:predicted nucleotidyltransferase